ncbi:hypothetical protein QEN63_gp45 [Streptomyces phage Vondra]|uniref:Uncharacterized protein n=1 Tax=Streptomyces phage Vondra TaxID=2736273 RepID=A0A6M9Z3T5_9CAUD|nr:hypothetical protein QEN63_gp45 [Streptomyces phage Vondra]QKN87630.1 hypothetical protein SEA_VONDRA_45 [Streptomyces phage Vondra]
MTSTPDAVAVASLDTHRLILTVPNDGPADVASNLPRPAVAKILRYVADQFSPAAADEHQDNAPADRPTAPYLSSTERQFLTFALDRAADTMRNEDGFTDADEDALSALRDLAETVTAVVAQPADGTEAAEDMARRFARRLHAVEQLCGGRPGYHAITVKALLTAMSDADDDQAEASR